MNIKHPILATLVVIAVSASVTTIGAYAYFNAKKSISTNKFSAGTLDLDVSSSGNVNEPIDINNVGATEEINGQKTWTIRNTGTLPGRLVFNLQDIKNLENGCNAPEKEAEPNCESDNIGELGKAMVVEAWVNGEKAAQTTLENNDDFVYDESLILQPQEEMSLTLKWQESPNGYGNEVQSDTIGFDMVFRLEQQ